LSGAEIRTGAWMMRGTIVSMKPLRLLPTFSYACTYQPQFMQLYAKHLHSLRFVIPHDDIAGSFQRYSGDTSVPGKGEILIWQPRG
jgi:formylmethanofuran dehydrogenase subunit C